MKISAFVVLLIASAITVPASAEIITLANFSGSESVINFDGLAGGSSLTTGEIITNQFAGLGATFARSTSFLTRANQNIPGIYSGESPPNVAFVAAGGGSSGVQFDPQQIIFSSAQNRVGMLLHGSSLTTVYLEVYQDTAQSILLETATISGQGFDSGASMTFLGIERSEGIAAVRMYSDFAGSGRYNFTFDDVRFESLATVPVPVPEPTSFAMFGIAMLGMARRRRVR